jgi:osmoprotectant transport system permease protein
MSAAPLIAVGPLAQTDTQPLLRWEWVADNVDEIVSRGAQHFWLTVVSVIVALAIAFPLAVLAHRRRWVIQPITWVSSMLYTIPALALISLLLPITGLSLTTVAIPLISYNLLILFRNTLTGLDGVDDDVVEAAQGMGFTRRQVLWRVQVPLAMPVIIAGIRIATVSSIGLVTIAALIGRGGFGQFILLGMNTFFWTPLVVGVVLSVAFAFTADLLLLGFERLTTPWARAAGTRTAAT